MRDERLEAELEAERSREHEARVAPAVQVVAAPPPALPSAGALFASPYCTPSVPQLAMPPPTLPQGALCREPSVFVTPRAAHRSQQDTSPAVAALAVEAASEAERLRREAEDL
eukprot:1209416-Amphidinium_carterae.1